MACKVFVIFTVLLVGTCESADIGWRRVLLRLKDKPTTCKIQDLTQPALNWPFAANLTCNTDAVTSMSSNDTRNSVVPGFECVFTYSCAFDRVGSRRRSSMVCGQEGEWEGELPDCTGDHVLAQAFIAFQKGFLLNGQEKDAESEQMNGSEEDEMEEIEEVEVSTATMDNEGGVKKRKRRPRLPKLKLACVVLICAKLRYRSQCQDYYSVSYRERFGPKLENAVNGFCTYCFSNYCNETTILI